ncbi:hypothetical protein FVR03_01230 [Pontibacter qinzhouensis]|uniref:Uncharacterized protein n=1 Tax=Pontibacter qinzhouensis TaxID=2603253 RepID=A0A5C8KE66_9BACT|nr:hypothetical protein [Pontibacter qinzhouensis]TXK52366.1 hypothetical protein FVR03_01230 [Pontibacter qinzhouensis]
MQTTLCKTDREEILRLLDLLDKKRFATGVEWLEESEEFKSIQKIASQEHHPSGDQSLLSNASSFSWERLLSMRDEAMKLFFNGGPQAEIEGIIQREIERRLLALLPQEK